MKQVVSAIDIGSSKVTCIIGSKDERTFDIMGMGVASFSSIQKKQIANPQKLADAVTRAIQEAETQSRHRVRQAFVGIPGCFIDVVTNSAHIDINPMNQYITVEDVNMLVDEAERFYVPERMEVIHRCPIWFETEDGFREIDPVGKSAASMVGCISYILADRGFLLPMCQVFDDLGIDIEMFVATPLSESMMLIPASERDFISILIDVGFSYTDISAVQGDGIIKHACLDVGGAHFASDISYVLGVSKKDAEQIKRRFVFGLDTDQLDLADSTANPSDATRMYNNANVYEIMEARAEEISCLLQKTIESWGLTFSKGSAIYLSGGGMSMMRGSREFLEGFFDIPVKLAKFETPKIQTPNYYSAISLLDFALNGVIESTEDSFVSGKIARRLLDFFTK